MAYVIYRRSAQFFLHQFIKNNKLFVSDYRGNMRSDSFIFKNLNTYLLVKQIIEYRTDIPSTIMEKNNKSLGIVRDGDSIRSYISELEGIKNEAEKLTGWFKYKITSMVNVSMLIAKSALIREESRGSHIRADFPDENDEFLVHFTIKLDSEPYKVNL